MNAPLPVYPSPVADYLAHGWQLCAIPPSSKGPTSAGWNLPENALKSAADLPHGWGVGLLHSLSGTMALDVDQWADAAAWLAERGVDLQALTDAPDAVQVDSGNPGHAKLLFNLPSFMALPTKKLVINGKTILEFRCATAEGLSVQDVIAGTHPTSGKDYRLLGDWRALPPIPAALLTAWQALLTPHSTAPRGDLTDVDWSEVRSALGAIPASVDHNTWLTTLMTLHSTRHPEAYEVARAWSMRCPEKYPGDRVFHLRWNSFRSDHPEAVGIGSLFHMAMERGWVRPAPDVTGLFEGVPPPAADTRSGWKFKPCDIRHMMSTSAPPIPWLFDHRWQAGRGYLLTGIGGSSKTRLMYMQAIAAITGVCGWGWSVVNTGKAALILTEDTPEEAHLTLESTIRAMGLTDEQKAMIADNLLVFALAGEDVKLLEMHGTVLRESTTLHGLEQMIQLAGNVVFIGLDPALGLTEGDENSQNHQRTLGRCADSLAVRTGAAVAVISHATKASNSADELNSHNSRGGGSITDAMRGEYSMRTMTAKEAQKVGIKDIAERKRYVQLVATKGNHLPPEAFVPIWFRRGDGGALTVASVSTEKPALAQLSHSHKRVLEVLVDEYSRGEEPVRRSLLKERCLFANAITGINMDAVNKSLTRALKALREGGFAMCPSEGVYVPIWFGEEPEE